MANKLYQMMQNQNQNPMMLLNQIKQNPMQFIMQRGFNVPQGMNNPQQIVQHLMNSGQISQNSFNKAVQMMNSFKQ